MSKQVLNFTHPNNYNVWYGSVCYNCMGKWLHACSTKLWAVGMYVQDNFGNLIKVEHGQ